MYVYIFKKYIKSTMYSNSNNINILWVKVFLISVKPKMLSFQNVFTLLNPFDGPLLRCGLSPVLALKIMNGCFDALLSSIPQDSSAIELEDKKLL